MPVEPNIAQLRELAEKPPGMAYGTAAVIQWLLYNGGRFGLDERDLDALTDQLRTDVDPYLASKEAAIATLTARVAEVDGECRRSMATIAELRAIADLERRAAENARLREALAPFAGAADELAAEYGVLMRPETGCSIKFSALAAARAALTDAEAAEWPSDGTCVRCGAAPRGADGLCATCHDEDSAALTATPAPSVERPYLTTYEVQVLLGCSIHGCGMRPDRTFKLPEAWRSLHALGLIDRTDGLAIVTDKGERVIAAIRAALSPPQQAGRETGERS